MKTLKLGMRDAAVKILQTELNRIGNKLTADGAFGPGTLAAVKSFQQSLQLVADGIVGYSTWQALFFHQRPAAARLTEDDFRLAALLLDCETAALKSVQKVETAGRGGFLAAGKRLHTLPEVDKDPLQRWHRRIRSPRAGTQDKR